jgi:cytochrome c-type biogenesis protein CcmH/NrfF
MKGKRRVSEMGRKTGKGNSRKCQNCGQFNELQSSFCGQCGASLGGGQKNEPTSQKREFSYAVVIGIIAVVVAAGLVLKMVTSSPSRQYDTEKVYQSSPGGGQLEDQVVLVASNFKCACGGCGELPLAECQCDMARGALEEKAFIRAKLQEGFSVDQVIQMVDETYGLRVPS